MKYTNTTTAATASRRGPRRPSYVVVVVGSPALPPGTYSSSATPIAAMMRPWSLHSPASRAPCATTTASP